MTTAIRTANERSLCPKCGIDLTGKSDDELLSHRQFHRFMAAAPKSIPSQDSRPSLNHNWLDRSREETRQQFVGWSEI